MEDLFSYISLNFFDFRILVFDNTEEMPCNSFENNPKETVGEPSLSEESFYKSKLFIFGVSLTTFLCLGFVAYYYADDVKSNVSNFSELLCSFINQKNNTIPELSESMKSEIRRLEILNAHLLKLEQAGPVLAQTVDSELTNSHISSIISRLDNPRFPESEIGPIASRLKNPIPLRFLTVQEVASHLERCIREENLSERLTFGFDKK